MFGGPRYNTRSAMTTVVTRLGYGVEDRVSCIEINPETAEQSWWPLTVTHMSVSALHGRAEQCQREPTNIFTQRRLYVG